MNFREAERVILIGVPDDGRWAEFSQVLDLTGTDPATWEMEGMEFLARRVRFVTTKTLIEVERSLMPLAQPLVNAAKMHYAHSHINQNSLEQGGERQARNFVQNLASLAASEASYLGDHEAMRSLRGRTALLVGAGASLDDHAELIAAFPGPVICVNTSLGAVLRYRKPELCVVLESKCVTEGLSAELTQHTTLACDMTSHPANHQGTRPALFIGNSPNIAAYGEGLDMLPIAYGPSCMNAAVSLALAFGAAKIVLVGQDCAYVDGRMYAKGTPYEATTVVIDEAKSAATVDKPTMGGPITYGALRVPAIGGGEVWTNHAMLSMAFWFAELPAEICARIVNCTSRGVAIESIEHRPLFEVIKELPAWTPSERVAEAEPGSRQGAKQLLETLRETARKGLSFDSDTKLVDWVWRRPILHCWISPERLRMRRETDAPTPQKIVKRIADVTRRACVEIGVLLG